MLVYYIIIGCQASADNLLRGLLDFVGFFNNLQVKHD